MTTDFPRTTTTCDFDGGEVVIQKVYIDGGPFTTHSYPEGGGSDHLATWCGNCGPKHREHTRMTEVEVRQGPVIASLLELRRTTNGVFAVGDNRSGIFDPIIGFKKENRYVVVHIESGLTLPRPDNHVLSQSDALAYAQFAEDERIFEPISGAVVATDQGRAFQSLRNWKPERLR